MLSLSRPLLGGLALGFVLGMVVFYAMSTSINTVMLRQQMKVDDEHQPSSKPTYQPENSALHRANPTKPSLLIKLGPKPTYPVEKPAIEIPRVTDEPKVILPNGLSWAAKTKEAVRPDMSPPQAEEAFYKNVVKVSVKCEKSIRLGHRQDGGWDMCIVPPFLPAKPCLVYSFGINNDWSFDDDISRRYSCNVKAFDPSMKVGDHKHSAKVWFYATGIGGTDVAHNPKGWKLRKFSTLLNELGDQDKIIDYLKIDVEYSEWDSLKAMLASGVLSRVRQFGFEIHTSELLRRQTSPALFTDYNNILLSLEKQGFHRWYSHFNQWGKYFSPRTHKQRTCCYEMVYINLNFLDKT